MAPVELSPANHLVLVAKHLLAEGNWLNAISRTEGSECHPRVRAMVKTVGVSSDPNYGGALADWKTASDAWFPNLQPKSVFFSALGNGIRLVPLGQRMGAAGVSVTAGIIGEGQTIPVSDLTLAGSTLGIIKAVAQIVMSKEVARLETPAAQAFVDQALQDGVAAAVDEKFFSVAMAGAPSFASQGSGSGDISEDLRNLLDSVNTTGAGRLLMSAAPNVGNALAIMDQSGRMSPGGGAFKGIETLVSPNQAGGTLRLFNTAGFAGAVDPVQLAVSEQADVDLRNTPDSPPSSATVLTSLFQHGLAAIKCTVPFGIQKIRSDAAAELTGVAWGHSP
ncbi:MAG TPA: hypothetical protein VJQ06_02020 [Rhizomicrobium sp.]|nr:hypothetical protein [Rhizomicrobium sp.]